MKETIYLRGPRWTHLVEFTSGQIDDATYALEVTKLEETLFKMQRDAQGARWGIERCRRGLGLNELRAGANTVIRIVDVLEGVSKKRKPRRRKSARKSLKQSMAA